MNRFRLPELPLFKRELLELAQQKRTYALRALCLFVFSLVGLVYYVETTSRIYNISALLGHGRE
ncbi:MAG: hypothetical protein KDA96_29230, partial [Planctomycetaceae bacterium]|nr:hypothetical protein [Planctomycetaceae bacterium]